jgi:hypothetical protein
MNRRRLAVRAGDPNQLQVDSRIAEYNLRRNGSGAAGVGDFELGKIDSRFGSLDKRCCRPSLGYVLQVPMSIVDISTNRTVEVPLLDLSRIITDPRDRDFGSGDRLYNEPMGVKTCENFGNANHRVPSPL